MSCVSSDSDPAVTCNGPSCQSASGCEVEKVASPALLVVAAIAGSVSGQCHPCVAAMTCIHAENATKFCHSACLSRQLHGALLLLLSLSPGDEVYVLAVI